MISRLPATLERVLADPLGYILAIVGAVGAALLAQRLMEPDELAIVIDGSDLLMVPVVVLSVGIGACVGLVLLVGRRKGAIRTGIAMMPILIVAGVVGWALGPIPEPEETLQMRALGGVAFTAFVARLSVATIPRMGRSGARR